MYRLKPFTNLKNLRERGENYFFFFLFQVTDKLQYEARQLSFNGSGVNVRAVFHGMAFNPMLLGEANSFCF